MEFLQNEFGIFLISYVLTLLFTSIAYVKEQQKELKIYLIRRFGPKYRLITFLGMMLLVVALPTILSYFTFSFSNMVSSMPMGFALALYVSLNRIAVNEEDLTQE
jgi:membrane protease YdiL (CAAX protease family)